MSLKWSYMHCCRNCTALFYPSLFEGFGIPILEGISMQKPVFCSDLPVFREIVGDAVNYFDPNRIDFNDPAI